MTPILNQDYLEMSLFLQTHQIGDEYTLEYQHKPKLNPSLHIPLTIFWAGIQSRTSFCLFSHHVSFVSFLYHDLTLLKSIG